MAYSARLMMGPRDGETLAVVEAQMTISVMAEPTNPETGEYAEHLYLREKEPRAGGVWYYIYAGARPKEQEQP